VEKGVHLKRPTTHSESACVVAADVA